jgi:hypothetical protein
MSDMSCVTQEPKEARSKGAKRKVPEAAAAEDEARLVDDAQLGARPYPMPVTSDISHCS